MTPRLPALRPREVIRALEGAGFSLHHVTGSHHYFRHPDRPALRVTVPVHAADLKRGTLAAVIKQAGLTTEDLCGRQPALENRHVVRLFAAAMDGKSVWIASEYIGQSCTLAEYVAAPIGSCGDGRTSLGNWRTRITEVVP